MRLRPKPLRDGRKVQSAAAAKCRVRRPQSAECGGQEGRAAKGAPRCNCGQCLLRPEITALLLRIPDGTARLHSTHCPFPRPEHSTQRHTAPQHTAPLLSTVSHSPTATQCHTAPLLQSSVTQPHSTLSHSPTAQCHTAPPPQSTAGRAERHCAPRSPTAAPRNAGSREIRTPPLFPALLAALFPRAVSPKGSAFHAGPPRCSQCHIAVCVPIGAAAAPL